MIKLFSKNSYRWSLLGLIVIVTIGAIGLTSAKDTSSNMNSEPFTNIVVNGDATRSSFSSVDFVDADTGWMVKSQYNSYHQDSQILKTENGGETWSTINLKGLNITKLKFIDKLRGWAIAEVNETSQSSEETDIRILYTKDGGESWDTQWENKMKPYYGYDLQFYGENHGYALINGLLLTTEDGGSKWSPATYDVKNFTPQHMSFTDASNGWVIGEVNYTNNIIVLRTKDGGKHWQEQFSPGNKDQSIGTIDIQFINQTTGWFLTSNMDTWMGDLYYTSDGGESWQSIHQIKSVRPSPRELYFVTPKIGWIPLDVGAGPISGGLLYTKDGGKNFDVINNDSSMISMKEVDFISENEGWAIGSYPNIGDYLIHTNDGGKTWTQVYPKIRPTKDISFIDNQHGFGIGQNSNQDVILYTKDSGETWNEIHDFSDQYRLSKLSFIDAKNGYVIGEEKGTGKIVILKTMDGGVTWDSLNGNYPQEQLWSLEYFKFFDSEHGLLISPKGDKVVFYRTEDGGHSWRGIEQDKSVMKSSVQYSFISSQEGWMAYNTLINSSKNSKATYGINLYQIKWDVDALSLGELGSNNYLYGIYFMSEDKGWMIEQEHPFNGEFHLMVTNDGGKTWTSHPFPTGFKLNMIQNQLPMQFTDEQHGWILSAEGLLTTNDGGRTWNWKE